MATDSEGKTRVKRKWDEAVKKGPGPDGRGFKLNEDRPGYTPRGTVPPPTGGSPAAVRMATRTPMLSSCFNNVA